MAGGKGSIGASSMVGTLSAKIHNCLTRTKLPMTTEIFPQVDDTGALRSRHTALDLLIAVLDGGQPLGSALEGLASFATLAERDRAFVRHLVSTSLRRLGQINGVITACIERPPRGKARAVLPLLQLGICQILFLKTPAHAAVDTTVRLARQRGLASFTALVNAVLRRVDREGVELLTRQDAARLNTPDWLWDSWSRAYGEAICREIAAAHLVEPPLDLSVKAEAEQWAARLGGHVLPTGTIRLANAGTIPALPGFASGAWWVQDAAAALPARLLGAVGGRKVIDLCAAPGGKTAQLAAAGAVVTAVERDTLRLTRLADNLRRLSVSAALVAADVESWRPEVPAEAVLLDAPCTATGTVRRHPDIVWARRPGDVGRLTPIQGRLLLAAAEMVAPGGILIYAVCSLQPEEGPERVAAFLASGAPFRREPIDGAEIGGLDVLIDAVGDLRTLPCHLAGEGGMDGFYACRLRRLEHS